MATIHMEDSNVTSWPELGMDRVIAQAFILSSVLKVFFNGDWGNIQGALTVTCLFVNC